MLISNRTQQPQQPVLAYIHQQPPTTQTCQQAQGGPKPWGMGSFEVHTPLDLSAVSWTIYDPPDYVIPPVKPDDCYNLQSLWIQVQQPVVVWQGRQDEW